MPQIFFEGTVFSGSGEGKKFIDLPWVKSQIQRKLGFTPYSGTLNLHLTKDGIKKRIFLQAHKRLEVTPHAGYCTGIIFKAEIDRLEAGVILPIVANYPNNILEVIAPVCLRQSLNLVDGSLVSVKVNV